MKNKSIKTGHRKRKKDKVSLGSKWYTPQLERLVLCDGIQQSIRKKEVEKSELKQELYCATVTKRFMPS